MSIQPLPRDVVAQIKSSTAITSLNGVISELVQNSLDAGSTKINISVEYGKGGCVVEDDGLGILPSEFWENGGLGKLHHSSKLHSQSSVHGGCGTFLASLSAMSLLFITSHHHLYRSHNTLSMHKSEVVSRQVPAPAQQYLASFDHGTRVSVRNLFGNMPVRVKQRAINFEKPSTSTKEWQNLKSVLVSLLLPWPNSIVLSLRELSSNQSLLIRMPSMHEASNKISRVPSVLSQTSFITPDEKRSWIPVSASTPTSRVSGTISLDPSPTKYVQFLSIDIQPLLAFEGRSILHDEINRLFANSAFGNEEEIEELNEAEISRRAKDARYKGDGHTNKELKRGRKGVDRWPMFYINIQRPWNADGTKPIDLDDILDDKPSSLASIIELLQVMVFGFLTRHHFRPKALRGNTSDNAAFSEAEIHTELPPNHGERKTVEVAESLPKKSSSPRRAVSKKDKAINIRSTDSDLLGSNIKLPSFRRPLATSDSLFDGWSRMKSGVPKIGSGKVAMIPSERDIQRPAPAPPPSIAPNLTLSHSRSTTPLISSSGKLTRRPFQDMPVPSKRQRSMLSQLNLEPIVKAKAVTSQPLLESISPKQDESDVVAWINPITKVKSVINRRTGHTIPMVNMKASRLSTQSLLSSSPSLTQQLSTGHRQSTRSEASPWLASLLENWDNPVFHSTEPSIPQVVLDGETEHVLHGHRHNCSQIDINRAFSESSSSIAGRITKAALKNAEVIGQVDRKFVLVNVSVYEDRMKEKLLVIIDQHAADERIRIENLLEELCTPTSIGMPDESSIMTTYLHKAIIFELSLKDIEHLAAQKSHFADWGIIYDIPLALSKSNEARPRSNWKQQLTIRALPPGIAERCKSDPKLLIDLIRTELYSPTKPSYHSALANIAGSKTWLSRIHTCPPTLLTMLNSRACRSAIMFNDVLSREQCEVLVRRLAETAFPFQCAHGRPSMLPLVEIGSVFGDRDRGESGFERAFKAWKDGMRK